MRGSRASKRAGSRSCSTRCRRVPASARAPWPPSPSCVIAGATTRTSTCAPTRPRPARPGAVPSRSCARTASSDRRSSGRRSPGRATPDLTRPRPGENLRRMTGPAPLDKLVAGMQLLVNGDHVVSVDADLAARFAPGDSLAAVGGKLLHLPRAEREIARPAVDRATAAFARMGDVEADSISEFFRLFAEHLADDRVWSRVLEANQRDVEVAQARGRSTTRLEATEAMREGMIAGLRGWAQADSPRGKVIERVDHGSWSAELVGAELGVVAFVFEGRPNVVADATGVLRGGNTVVFRIGRDALGTARTILELATRPALRAAGLPEDAVTLVDSSEHAAAWALFSDRRLALAVARGSGPAVDTLGQ